MKKERVTESGRTDKLRIIEDIQLVKPREDGGNVRRKEDPSGTFFPSHISAIFQERRSFNQQLPMNASKKKDTWTRVMKKERKKREGEEGIRPSGRRPVS